MFFFTLSLLACLNLLVLEVTGTYYCLHLSALDTVTYRHLVLALEYLQLSTGTSMLVS
jgi:hypothetical protein